MLPSRSVRDDVTKDQEENLDRLEARLREGFRLGMQTSYGRRMPLAPALPALREAARGLTEFTDLHPTSERAWRLRSLAEESLLDYGRSYESLRRAMELSMRRDRKDMKKLAGLRQSETDWRDLLLTPPQLEALGEYLSQVLGDGAHTSDLRWTQAWLAEHEPQRVVAILAALRNRGGYTDIQVLHNVVRG